MQKEDKVKNTGMEIGLYTLGDMVPDPNTGKSISAGQRIKLRQQKWPMKPVLIYLVLVNITG